jgi:uncharacterized protein YjdB
MVVIAGCEDIFGNGTEPGSGEPVIVAVTGVTINTSSLFLMPESTATLTAAVSPADTANKAVTWSSDNEAVDRETGAVPGVAEESATITVTTVSSGKTDTCAVTVKPKVSGVSLDYDSLTLMPEGSATLTATVGPAHAPDTTVTWESSDTNIATVDNGTVTGVAGESRLSSLPQRTVAGWQPASFL